MAKESGSGLTPVPLWIGFLEGNFDRGFLTTLGLLLPCLGGIFSSKISIISLVKKKVIVQVECLESHQLPVA
jgi:hypothetical protein